VSERSKKTFKSVKTVSCEIFCHFLEQNRQKAQKKQPPFKNPLTVQNETAGV
jgi:hypothetical protein